MTDTRGVEYQEALALAREGYSVFPVHKSVDCGGYFLCTCGQVNCKGKHPAIEFSKDNTTSIDRITRYEQHTGWGNRGIGIHCGKSYCWVLDIDGEKGKAELKEITDKYGELPITRTVKTGGDGLHYYFAGWCDKIHSGKLSENIDIKGNATHAYVVAPPTKHYSGNRYEYLNRCPPVDGPEWLISLVNARTFNGNAAGSHTLSEEKVLARRQYEVPITRLLSKEQAALLHQEGSTLRGTNPAHGSKNRRNFAIDLTVNRWFCNRCEATGGLFELAAMLAGICKCDEFKRVKTDGSTPALRGKKFIQAVQFCLDAGIDAEDLKVHLSGGAYVRQ